MQLRRAVRWSGCSWCKSKLVCSATTRILVIVISMLVPLTCTWAAGTQAKNATCHPTFSEYPVTNIFTGKRIPPNINQTHQVHLFRTVIREGAEGQSNFAGHYRVIEWGCGSPCHAFAIVDQETGDVYIVPVVAGLEAQYKVDSSLFIIDPAESIEEYYRGDIPNSGSMFLTYYFVWNSHDERLQKIRGCGYPGVGSMETMRG